MQARVLDGSADFESSARWLEHAFATASTHNYDEDAIINAAWVNAITERDSVDLEDNKRAGELLLLDSTRLLSMRRLFDAWVRVACMLCAVQEYLASYSTTSGNELTTREVAKALLFLFHYSDDGDNCNSTSNNANDNYLLAQIATGTLMQLQSCQFDGDYDIEKQLLDLMDAVIESGRAAELKSILKEYMLESLSSKQQKKDHHPVVLAGMPAQECFVEVMQPRIDILNKMVTVSKMTHIQRYREMLLLQRAVSGGRIRG